MYFKLTWDDWYELAKNYYKHHGDLKIKQGFNTINGYEYNEEGYKLGVWLNNQKTRYKNGILTDEQKKKLEQLGLDFKTTQEFRWNRMYELAKLYRTCHGDLKVQQNFRTIDGCTYNKKGYKLGVWINDQRAHYKTGKISAERVEKLKAIGLVLDGLWEDNWNKMYELAQKYYVHYGHLKVPVEFKTRNGYEYNEQGKNLGSWILTQRRLYAKKNISLEHIGKLSQIGMIFEDVYDKEWERVYNLARAYYEHYGHLYVKFTFKTKDGYTYDEGGYCLHTWLDTQRMMYKQNKLSEERIKKLQLIGMLFEIRKNKEENVAVCEKHGINYCMNKQIIDSISNRELAAKINYLNCLGEPLTISNQLHPIFAMGNINMQAKYGISLEVLLTEYLPSKEKII